VPEQPKWRFEKLIKPMFDIPTSQVVLKGRVLTGVGDEVIEDGFVEIDGADIKAVGRLADLGDTDAEVIETGWTIIPGLWNNHTHMGWDGVHDLAAQSINDSREIVAYKYCGNMLRALRAGLTTCRDLGVHDTNLVTKQAVQQGIFPGPRLLVTGAPIVQTGGHTFWMCREASGADEMRRAVREQVRGGADLIKIMGCHDTLEFTDEELEAVIDESHRMGVPITAHATYDACISRCVRFGVDVVEHGGEMTDETIQMLVDKQIPIVSTFSPMAMQANAEHARQFNIPEWKIKERQRALESGQRFQGLVEAAKAGVPIIFGTDSGSPAVPIDAVVPEMDLMVKLGVVEDNYGAIRSATSVSATASKMDDKVGTLEAGKLADVVVIKGNPLEDLEALTNVEMTFLEGKRVV
jgi:imidazolonepropionase-like amidohydrolase